MRQSSSPINIVWLVLIVGATVVAAFKGTMSAVNDAMIAQAIAAVQFSIKLIGGMALWLGIMKVLEVAGAMRALARVIRPVTTRLFPDVPAEHPAMSAMIMNFAANMLGLGNAATPMGIKAMHELDSLNPEKGTATNAMCLFLAINTSSITLLPLGVIVVRASAGASNPAAIILPSMLATGCSTAVAIVCAKLMARNSGHTNLPAESKSGVGKELNTPVAAVKNHNSDPYEGERVPPGTAGKIIMGGCILAFAAAVVLHVIRGNVPPLFSRDFLSALSVWLLPLLMSTLLLIGFFRGVKVYEVVTDGAKEGFNVAVRIIPFLVAIFVGIGMFRASGALDLIKTFLQPVTSFIGMPAEALPMALLRPLSGSGAFGVMSEIVANSPDSLSSFIVSTMQGSTETTFYVLAVYFGAVGIKRTRHALPAALCADGAGIFAAVWISRLFFRVMG